MTQRDVMKQGLSVYHIDRCIKETSEWFDDGAHILYVNGEYRDDTPIGKLMHDFSCEKPDDMNYEILAERVRYFKESKEGHEIMCRTFEELIEQGVMEGKLSSVKNLMDTLSLSVEEALEALKVTDSEKSDILENIEKEIS